MSRTTDTAVKAILLRDYDTRNSPSLDSFIETASALVDDLVDCATGKGVTFSAGRLELIERYLAAHFYQQSDKGFTSKSTGDASASYQGKTDMYLTSTLYGQTAITLDKTGCLRSIGTGQVANTARGIWLGKKPSEQLRYDERD
jgi:hypothetical protein